MKGFIEWKNRLDEMKEAGCVLTTLENDLWNDLQSFLNGKNNHVEIIENRDVETFKKDVAAFLDTHNVLTVKFQRNIFYSIPGDKLYVEEEGKKLVEEYVAFIVWRS